MQSVAAPTSAVIQSECGAVCACLCFSLVSSSPENRSLYQAGLLAQRCQWLSAPPPASQSADRRESDWRERRGFQKKRRPSVKSHGAPLFVLKHTDLYLCLCIGALRWVDVTHSQWECISLSLIHMLIDQVTVRLWTFLLCVCLCMCVPVASCLPDSWTLR